MEDVRLFRKKCIDDGTKNMMLKRKTDKEKQIDAMKKRSDNVIKKGQNKAYKSKERFERKKFRRKK